MDRVKQLSHAEGRASVDTTDSDPGSSSEAVSTADSSYVLEPELQALKELQEMLAPLKVDEFTGRRFVRAKKGDLKGAAKQYRAFLAWRKKERIDEVLTEPLHAPEIEAELQRVGMRPLDGHDLAGRPVVVAALGRWDMHHLKKHGVTLPMLVRRHAKAMELLVQHVREAPDPLAGSLLIFDLSGCSASKFLGMWGYIREIAPICEQYYPELLGKMYLVRGSSWLKWGVDKVKLILDPVSATKMELMFGDVMPVLRASLPLSTALPPELGIATPAEQAADTQAAGTAPSVAPPSYPVPVQVFPSHAKRVRETRYVTIELPVDGGKAFDWTVDDVDMTFIAPEGKRKGHEHEFSFAAAQRQAANEGRGKGDEGGEGGYLGAALGGYTLGCLLLVIAPPELARAALLFLVPSALTALSK
ncbi:sec14 cytosolic factor [Chrysochromulina tobinii]|uniref:Sec14 cytosolic factor n=1 Tax=Chrysochromulina tobinii TaxID=1460289 RepID=A0A0M0K0M2_9EUKA|nr:sec14 cytosolic factor [Chrysochromulina tobinii]|eukprot:KOO31933.1 sec14 cytosolic factor [Chrysochromulina sp. CCMP291]